MAIHFNLRTVLRTTGIALASAAVLVSGAQAQSHFSGGRGGAHYGHVGGPGGHYHGGYGGGYYRGGGPGWLWGGVGLGLGLGLASYYAYPSDPGYVVVNPPVVYTDAQPVPLASAPVPARSSSRPVIYPRNGQTAAQLESDSNACSQWSGSQPNATADANVFRRGVEACMDARGYTLR